MNIKSFVRLLAWTKKKQLHKKLCYLLLGSVLPLIVGSVIFAFKTGQLPYLQTYKRNIQIIKKYFSENNNSNIVVKIGRVNTLSETSCLVCFRKDPFYNSLFLAEGIPEETFRKEDWPIEKRVMIFEENDFNILNYFFSFVFPIKKSFEISGPLEEFVRLLDVTLIDLDSDGSSEIFIQWSEYYGGSGGINYPLVIKVRNDTAIFTPIPRVKIDPNSTKLTICKNVEIPMRINGKIENISCNPMHTDIFYKFEDFDEDKITELIMAYPEGDWEYHFGPQTWHVVVYQYLRGKFVVDPDFDIDIVFPKDKKLGLSQIHGYTIIPDFGQLFWMWCPSWLDLTQSKIEMLKSRRKSEVIIQLQKIKKQVINKK